MLNCLGSGHELSSASTVLAVCHDLSVFLMRLFLLSIIVELSESITWSKVHAYFATFEPLTHCFVFLTCSFFLVLNDLFFHQCSSMDKMRKGFCKQHCIDRNNKQRIYANELIKIYIVFRGSRNLGAGNSCWRVFIGLLVTWKSWLLRIRVSASVIPLM